MKIGGESKEKIVNHTINRLCLYNISYKNLPKWNTIKKGESLFVQTFEP